jgi:hypothetical protein
MPVALRSRGIEPIPPRPEPISCIFHLLAMLPTRSFVHRALLHSQVSVLPYCISVLAHLLQAVRRYASAAPTAAFAGQKGSNVRLRISPYASIISSLATRVNTPLHSSPEMVRQGVVMEWIITVQ